MSTDSYVFVDRHVPALRSGGYTMTATLDVGVGAEQEKCAIASEFWIGGERYSLGPADIHSVYPPELERGQFAATIPHIALARDTLPWERDAGSAHAPWFALIVLHESEAARCPLQTMTLADYKKHCAKAPENEPGQDDSDQVQVVTLDAPLARTLIPTLEELSVLCHVRGHMEGEVLARGIAVVLSRRLAKPGKNTAHLVSLEGRYENGVFDASGREATLVSLSSWSFFCEPQVTVHPESPLARIFAQVDPGWLSLPYEYPRPEIATTGRATLEHQFRTGETSASFYGGPLVPGGLHFEDLRLPVRCSDELLYYYKLAGMFDVTYAAAWELGRMMALENRVARTALATWRRRRVLDAHHANAQASAHHHLPQIQRAPSEHLPQEPGVLLSWLRGLRRLENVPYHYLVPDEAMLPPESIRFFEADTRWLDALTDGVLSLARLPRTVKNDVGLAAESALRASLPEHDWQSGFILRSAAVSGWPSLEVEALDVHRNPIDLVRRVELSPSTTMYLFSGKVGAVSVRRHRDTAHLEIPQHRMHDIFADETQRVLKIDRGQRSSQLAGQLLHHAEALEVTVAW